eukprot:symbB.v1.2.024209.t1/scaffold2270.1/size83764/3
MAGAPPLPMVPPPPGLPPNFASLLQQNPAGLAALGHPGAPLGAPAPGQPGTKGKPGRLEKSGLEDQKGWVFSTKPCEILDETNY